MSVARMRNLLANALRGGYCVGYFEAWDQYSLEACLEAAEQTRSPAIVGFGAAVTSQSWLDRWGVEELAGIARRLAEMASVPAAVLFNEARTMDQIRRGLDAGCNAVMLDSSRMPYAENLAATKEVVALARGHGADVEVADVDMEMVARCRVLYVGGYFIMPGFDPESLARLMRFARESGVLTVLDVAGVDPRGGMEKLAPALPYTDAFLPNDDEAALLTGHRDPVRQAQILGRSGAGTVVVTLGEKGTVAWTSKRVLRTGAFPTEVVDASGSGDAFAAGFIVGMLEGWDLDDTLAFASALGASCCTRLGCTAGVFNREQAESFIASHALAVTEITGGGMNP